MDRHRRITRHQSHSSLCHGIPTQIAYSQRPPLSSGTKETSLPTSTLAYSFIAYLGANITGTVFSVGYLPVVILAPIGAINLVFNAIAARVVLGDPFTVRSVGGTLLIIVGALLVGLFGVIQEPNHSLEALLALYKRPAFIIYFSILESFILVTMVTTHLLEHFYHQWEEDMTPDQKLLGSWLSMADLKVYIGISYGVLGGNISSQSLLFAKSGLELFILTIVYGENQLQHAWTWGLVVMTVVTAALQLYYLNKGLRLCDTMILIPLSFCAFNISCLFNGLVYYNQWDLLRWWQLLYVLIGVALTVSGVLCLSWRSSSPAISRQEEIVVENTSDGYGAIATSHMDIDHSNRHSSETSPLLSS